VSVPVEVIWLDMDAAGGASLAAFWQTLGEDERERASRFRFARDRGRFVVRRGALRALLARHLGCAASAIRYSRNQFGKPALAASHIRFNVSHSHSIALYAVADGIEVGCDIERVDSALDIQAISERFFAPQEISMLQSLPGHLRHAGFFNCWTRKEAYLKCRGCGLSEPPDSCVVSLAPGEPTRLLMGDEGVSLSSLETVPGYRAALAVEAMDAEIREPHDLATTCIGIPAGHAKDDRSAR
jgi:4'-phosphopantetheinyl transferase